MMAFRNIVDPESGDVIGYYDETEMLAIPLNNIDQDAVDRAAAIMLADPSGGLASGSSVFDRPSVINWAVSSPPPDPIAAGLNPKNLVKTSDGSLWKYVQTRSPTGTVSYTPMPATGAAVTGGISPVMWAAIAGLAILALT
jgi:hypothetical protein